MMDFIWTAIITMFNYFFAENAPMTSLFIITGFMAMVILKQWARRVVRPLQVEHNAAELLKMQMQLVDDTLDELHSKLYGLYRSLRKNYISRDQLDMDMQTFMHSLQLWGVHGQIQSEIRKFFRDNHLAEKTPAEFHVYKDMRKQHVWTRMTKGIDEYWYGGMLEPDRSQLYDLHDEHRDSILSIVDRIFDQGRDIAIQYKDMLSNRKKSFSITDLLPGSR